MSLLEEVFEKVIESLSLKKKIKRFANLHQDMVEEIALYRKFPKLKELPWIELIDAPTPIQKMENASNSLRGCDIWIKRDDLCNPKYGGNKPRKYEFVLADAIKQGKKIVTIGGIGSNHVLADAIYSKDLGLTTEGYSV